MTSTCVLSQFLDLAHGFAEMLLGILTLNRSLFDDLNK